MNPNKFGQVVKFCTPKPDENPGQLIVVLETIEDVERPRTDIKALNTSLSFPPFNTVLPEDNKVLEFDTDDLLGQKSTINNTVYSCSTERVITVNEQKIILDLTKGVKGGETNVWLTIEDENNKEHTGTLFVS